MRNITDLGSFAVKNDGSEDFKKFVLDNLDATGAKYGGFFGFYYGINKQGNTRYWGDVESTDVPILTVQQVKDYLLSGVRPGEEKKETDYEILTCPFCKSTDFDAPGLKRHIIGYCEEFDKVENV